MPDLSIRTRGGGETALAAADLDRLAASVRGEVVTRDAPHYEEVRRIWNGTVERRPSVIVRCRSASDVVRTIRFARERDLLIGVRGGGHNIAGNALVDGGLLVDLSLMRGVHVDPRRHLARSEPGVLLSDFDRDTQAFGLATPLGINSTTGIAGLTLGGGYGWLSRSLGLTVDNLRSADVVTASGELVTASEGENSDLFWALRGGGGNFGVVTSFEYELRPVGPEVLAGVIAFPFQGAAGLLRRFRDLVSTAPDAFTAWMVLRKAPPLPFLPESAHGVETVLVPLCHAGDRREGERIVHELRAIGTPLGEMVGPMPYVTFQTLFDPLLGAGARNYWKSHNFSTLHDGLVDTIVAQIPTLPGPACEIFLAHLGGAVSRRPEDATAYAGRAAQFVMNVHARWEDRVQDERCIEWARGIYSATAPFASAGAYVNFLTQDEGDRVRAAYGTNFDRLTAVKAKYDPENVFRTNQNIPPAMPAAAPGIPARGVAPEVRPM